MTTLTTNRKNRFDASFNWRGFISQYGIVGVLLLLIFALSIITPIVRGEQYFLTVRNMLQIGLQASINVIIAVGMTYVITSGGIDLSVGSIVALAGVLAALAMRDWGFGAYAGFAMALSVGAVAGLANGLLITRLRLPAFIVTLGTMGIFRGIALVIADGRSIYGFGGSFFEIFSGNYGVIPKTVVFAGVVAAIGWFVLTQTRFGKYTIAIGGSEETSHLSGIPVNRYRLGIYTLCGLLSGFAGGLLLGRLRSGDPTFGQLYELDAIAAVVMGGTSLTGGEGSITGTIIGALIISIVRNAMNILNMPSYYQQVVIGSVIIFAITLDQWRRQQASRT